MFSLLTSGASRNRFPSVTSAIAILRVLGRIAYARSSVGNTSRASAVFTTTRASNFLPENPSFGKNIRRVSSGPRVIDFFSTTSPSLLSFSSISMSRLK